MRTLLGLLITIALSTPIKAQEREILGYFIEKDTWTAVDEYWFGCVNEPGFHWMWEATDAGAVLVLACEVTAYQTFSFHPALIDYVVAGLQYDLTTYFFMNGSAGIVYEDATVRLALRLEALTLDHAGEPFRVCYSGTCMSLTAPLAP